VRKKDKMKLSPLNIAQACLLVWYIDEWGKDQAIFPVWQISLFLILLLVIDLVFRFYVKELRRLWMSEIGFILMTGILVVLIKIM